MSEDFSDRSRLREMVMAILLRNAEKDFVQRVLNPGVSPSIPDGAGWQKTHLMSWAADGESDGRPEYYVYPQVMRDGPSLRDFGPGALEEAFRRGEFIRFASPDSAEAFSSGYKTAWDFPWGGGLYDR